MSRLDRFIDWISPSWGVSRRLARLGLKRTERMIGYEEGRPGRLDRTIYAPGAAPDWSLELGFDRRTITDRARQLERDNALACTLLDRSVEHVVGEGFQLKCKTDDKGWNKAAEEIWREWCQKECDSRRLLTFNEMLALVFRSWLRDGDVAAVLESDGSMRLVESDEIASPQNGYYKPTDADGVELDRRGRIIAFNVFDYDPTVLWSNRRTATPRLVRVPAEDVIFLARRQRSGQTRGLSVFNGISRILEQLDDSIEAVAVAHQMAACAGMYLQKKAPITGFSPQADIGRPEIDWEPGMVVRGDPDEDMKQISAEHPSGTFEILCTSLIRFAAARFGLGMEMVNFDFTKANYSNLRSMALEVAQSTTMKQRLVIQGFCREAWGFRLARAIREGDLTPRADAAKHVWGVPGKPWQDPEVELRAAMGAVDGALGTRREFLARFGKDFDEVAEEIAAENAKLEKLGIELCRSSLTRDPTPEPEPDGDEGGPEKKPGKNGSEKNGLNGH